MPFTFGEGDAASSRGRRKQSFQESVTKRELRNEEEDEETGALYEKVDAALRLLRSIAAG
jgi:hypothetical protein